MANAGVTEGTRRAIRKRSKGRCERCGQKFRDRPMDIHHRIQRSVGGNNDLSNLVGMDRLCHVQVHDAKDDAPYVTGWLVKSHDLSAGVPILMHDGWWLLRDDGGMERWE